MCDCVCYVHAVCVCAWGIVCVCEFVYAYAYRCVKEREIVRVFCVCQPPRPFSLGNKFSFCWMVKKIFNPLLPPPPPPLLYPRVCVLLLPTYWDQFHQRSTPSFYVRKFHAQLSCAYVLGLFFTGARLLVPKLCVECWWNWTLVLASISLDGNDGLRKIGVHIFYPELPVYSGTFVK